MAKKRKRKPTTRQKAISSYKNYIKNVEKLKDQGFAFERVTSKKEYIDLYTDAIKSGKTLFFSRRMALDDRIIGTETARRILSNFNKRQNEMAKLNGQDYTPLTLEELKSNIRKIDGKGKQTAIMVSPIKVMVKKYDENDNFIGWVQEEIMPTSTKQMIYLLQKYDKEGNVILDSKGDVKVDKYYGY